ncbi:EboA domain-containing protein [Agarilytica rhodophyticola]|uniref:EboA domain-containing protein n=1 Tax=Agarilytica rhodophyticola TaxID=1737490 RepID=UPI000B348554|nr:EboA domain-containing protein [Agarilytica rhodophyticola]
MTQKAITELGNLLAAQQSIGFDKIQSKIEGAAHIDQKLFFYLFAICTRWFDNSNVNISDSLHWQEKDSFGVITKWQWPSLARLYLLLLVADQGTKQHYIELYETLFNSADVQESIVLIQSLAFVPYPEAFVEKAREAARSNITSLFSAIAHDTDYPNKYFDELGWNQLILKAAFLNVPIISIHGLKSRNNESLVTMLRDYAKERQAASRSVPWDLWCCVAWITLSNDGREDLKTQFVRSDIRTKAAIALGLAENKDEDTAILGRQLLQVDELQQLPSPITWEIIANYEC